MASVSFSVSSVATGGGCTSTCVGRLTVSLLTERVLSRSSDGERTGLSRVASAGAVEEPGGWAELTSERGAMLS